MFLHKIDNVCINCNLLVLVLRRLSLSWPVYFAQRSGIVKLPTYIVPECREPANCARQSAAKEWTQGAGERTRRLYRQKPWQFGRGAVFRPEPQCRCCALWLCPVFWFYLSSDYAAQGCSPGKGENLSQATSAFTDLYVEIPVRIRSK